MSKPLVSALALESATSAYAHSHVAVPLGFSPGSRHPTGNPQTTKPGSVLNEEPIRVSYVLAACAYFLTVAAEQAFDRLAAVAVRPQEIARGNGKLLIQTCGDDERIAGLSNGLSHGGVLSAERLF